MSFRRTLPELTNFTLGTAGLSDKTDPEHMRVARQAMEAGVWFHSSAEYGKGSVFETLRAAFREDPKHIPRCIFKVHGEDPVKLRRSVEGAIRDTGVGRVDIAQICGRPSVGEDLQPGGGMHDAMCELLEEGLVGSYVIEFFRPTCDDFLRAVADDLFDGYTFYYGVVDREVSNPLFDLIQEKGVDVLALRTVGGGPGAPGYAGDRAAILGEIQQEVAALYERSGCASEVEFRMRFPLSVGNVRTTIGGTNDPRHLKLFLDTLAAPEPLPAEIVAAVQALHRRWFAE